MNRPEQEPAEIRHSQSQPQTPERQPFRVTFVDTDILPEALRKRMLGRAGLSANAEGADGFVQLSIRQRTEDDPVKAGELIFEAKTAKEMRIPRGLPVPPALNQRLTIAYEDPHKEIPPFKQRLKDLFKK